MTDTAKPNAGELLPCPFCGADAERVNGAVVCSNINCAAICGVPSTGFRRDHDPVAIWNTRSAASLVQAGTDAVREALLKAELGATIEEVLANYRAIRRAVQDASPPSAMPGVDREKIA